MRSIFLAAGCVLAASTAAAQRSAFDLPIREHRFDNGLRLLVLERAGAPRVAAKIFTDFGAIVEEPGELGAAHFLEHLMFKGTTTLGTTDWESERPLVEAVRRAEAALIEELNRERNTLRERGVFHDYAHARSTPVIDSLRAEIARLETEAAAYRDNGAMMRWYQAYGGERLTATTEQEYMKFDINLPVERIELFFRIEADRMRNSIFREFDEERMILVEQRLGDLNRPTTPYHEQMNAAVGVVHPVFWPEGYMTDFAQYTRAYQRDLYERYFVVNNTTIVLVGGVSLEAMVPLVERHFGWMQASALEPVRARAVEPLPQAERRVIYRSEDLAPRVEARFLMPGVGHPDRPHFDVMAHVIESEMAGALTAADLAAAVNVNTNVVHTSRFGIPSSINVELVLTRHEDLGAAETVLLAMLERVGRVAVDADRLARAKKQLRNDWFRTAANPDRLAFEIGHFQTMDSWTTLQPYLETRERTTAEDIMRLARRYFIPDNRTIGIVRRPEVGPRATSDGSR